MKVYKLYQKNKGHTAILLKAVLHQGGSSNYKSKS